MTPDRTHRAPAMALGAALLFGASTPFVKLLVGDLPALALAGLLYLGSGVGLAVVRILRDRGWSPTGLRARDWPWLAGAIASGGVVGPVLLVLGLGVTPAGTASLLLNLEAVLTAAIAWIAFREHASARTVAGMALIVAGGVLLSWTDGSARTGDAWGVLAIAGACACWAIDNNLTRSVSASDALFIASAKGLVAGAVNLGLALALGSGRYAPMLVAAAMSIGLLGYGASLVLFVKALRDLGTSRTGAYFSTAPFIGAALSIGLLGEPASIAFALCAATMAGGVWLHLTERHAHEHWHDELEHSHVHVHDEHHRHAHEQGVDALEPHEHLHRHVRMRHAHPHFPDIHHRHRH